MQERITSIGTTCTGGSAFRAVLAILLVDSATLSEESAGSTSPSAVEPVLARLKPNAGLGFPGGACTSIAH